MSRAEYQARYYRENKERLRAYRDAYYAEHRDETIKKNRARDAAALAADPIGVRAKRNDLSKAWAKKNPEKRRATVRKWREAHRNEHKAGRRAWYAANRDRVREGRNDAHRRLRLEMIAAYGGACACCGITDEPFLSLDHVNRDGRAHSDSLTKMVGAPRRSQLIYQDLKRRGWPTDGFRLLCMNCNFATRYGDTCPHVITQANEMLAGVFCS